MYKNVGRDYSLSDGIHARIKLLQTFAIFHTFWQINYTFKKQIKIRPSERYKRQNKRIFRLRSIRTRQCSNFLPFLLMSTSRKFVKLETADGKIVNSLSLKPRMCKLCSPNNACGRKKQRQNLNTKVAMSKLQTLN